METRANYVLIGAFTAAAVVCGFLVLVWLAGFEGQRDTRAFDIYFDGSVAGLSVGGDVRYNGIRVGEVKEIALGADPRLVRVRIAVDARTPVKTDSVAKLEFQGLTGVAFIEITGGSPSSPDLAPAPGEEVAVIAADQSAVQQLITSAPLVLTAANDLLIRIDRLIGENEGEISATVRDVETLSGTLAANHREIDELIKNLAAASRNVVALSQRLDAASVQMGDAARSYGALAEEARAMVAEARPGIQQLSTGSVQEVDRLLRDTRRLVSSLDRLAARIERDPGALLRGDAPAEYAP